MLAEAGAATAEVAMLKDIVAMPAGMVTVLPAGKKAAGSELARDTVTGVVAGLPSERVAVEAAAPPMTERGFRASWASKGGLPRGLRKTVNSE